MYQSRIRNAKKRFVDPYKGQLIEKEEGQDYAIVQDMVGNGRLRAYCSDGKVRMARIRGAMRKFTGKVLIEKGDLILISMRDFEEDNVDVIHKYPYEDIHKLSKAGSLPQSILKKMAVTGFGESIDTDGNDEYITFENETIKDKDKYKSDKETNNSDISEEESEEDILQNKIIEKNKIKSNRNQKYTITDEEIDFI